MNHWYVIVQPGRAPLWVAAETPMEAAMRGLNVDARAAERIGRSSGRDPAQPAVWQVPNAVWGGDAAAFRTTVRDLGSQAADALGIGIEAINGRDRRELLERVVKAREYMNLLSRRAVVVQGSEVVPGPSCPVADRLAKCHQMARDVQETLLSTPDLEEGQVLVDQLGALAGCMELVIGYLAAERG